MKHKETGDKRGQFNLLLATRNCNLFRRSRSAKLSTKAATISRGRPTDFFAMLRNRFSVVAVNVLAVVAAGIPFGTSAAIALDPESFLREYGPAAAKLEQFYSNCKISAVESQTRSDGPTLKSQMKFAGGNGKYKTSVTLLESPAVDRNGLEVVVMATERGGIWLACYPRTYKYVVESRTPNRSETLAAMRELLPAFGSYCFQRQRIVDFMAEAKFKIRGIDEHVKEQDGLVKVFWDSPLDDEQDGKVVKYSRTGWFVFDRKASWALRESTVIGGTTSQPVLHIGKVEMKYSDKDGDIPLVSECRSSSERPGERPSDFHNRYAKSFEDVKIEPGAASANDFELEPYGITELHVEGQSER